MWRPGRCLRAGKPELVDAGRREARSDDVSLRLAELKEEVGVIPQRQGSAPRAGVRRRDHLEGAKRSQAQGHLLQRA